MQGCGRVFAKVYNLLWNDFAKAIAPKIHDFYLTTGLGQSREPVLDLCCGTGRLSNFFLEKDFRVVGIDLSERQIKTGMDQPTTPYRLRWWMEEV